jgi:hypothetical protein
MEQVKKASKREAQSLYPTLLAPLSCSSPPQIFPSFQFSYDTYLGKHTPICKVTLELATEVQRRSKGTALLFP